MALTFTEKVRSQQGRRKMHVYQITADGNTTTINASDIDMNYIDFAIMTNQNAAMSSVADYCYLSDNGPSIAIGMANAGSSGATLNLVAWGW